MEIRAPQVSTFDSPTESEGKMNLSLLRIVAAAGRFFIPGMYALLIAALGLTIFVGMRKGYDGDERFYVFQAQFLQRNGLWQSLVGGIPAGFSYPMLAISKLGFSLMTSGRLLSLLSVIPIMAGVHYFSRKIFRFQGWEYHLVILLSLQVLIGIGIVFIAGSDMLFTAVLIWALILLWKMSQTGGSWRLSLLTGVLLALSLLIRPLTLLYLPGIVVGMLLALKSFTSTTERKRYAARCLATLATCFILFGVAQLPALIEKRTLSFENKDATERLTWSRRQLLSQLRYDDGSLAEGDHVTWKELDAYLSANGEDALPSSHLELVKRYPLMVTREFFKDLLVGSNYIFLRRTSFLYLVPFVFLFVYRQQPAFRQTVLLLSTISLLYVVTICTIILTAVEGRWYLLPLLLTIVAGMASLKHLVARRARIRAVSYLVICAFLVGSSLLDVRSILR